MKKRIIALLLICGITLLVALPAAALNVLVSPQSLTIDGNPVSVQAYNIDDYNFFRLRDLACLLNGTTAQFSVDYDQSTKTIVIVRGESYVPNGTELTNIADRPGFVVPSPQSLQIDGETVSDIEAYNIDDSNYFKLRDIGAALGFGVDYDDETDTMLVTTGHFEAEGELPADWSPDISFRTLDEKGNEWTDACFRDAKLTMINFWAYWCPPCCAEMPDLQRLSEDYAGQGLQLLGISDEIYEEDNIDTMADLGVTYPCLRYTYEFDVYMNTGYIPTTIFVDANGKVVGEIYIGSRDYSSWSYIIESLLP